MYDCLWNVIDFCECENKCSKYLSTNSDEGFELMQLWGYKVCKALEPLRKEFAKENGFKGEE